MHTHTHTHTYIYIGRYREIDRYSDIDISIYRVIPIYLSMYSRLAPALWHSDAPAVVLYTLYILDLR